VHYLDANFRLHQPLLAFEQLSGRHTGAAMADVVYDVLDRFDLTEKLNCITTDNASNNVTMMARLSRLLEEDGITWDPQISHVRCMAHVINLCVQSFLKGIFRSMNYG
jgi:hypothetical protein